MTGLLVARRDEAVRPDAVEPGPAVNATLAYTGLGLAVLTPIVVALPVWSLAKVLVVLAFACFGPGPALLCRARLGSGPVAWAIALVLSLSLFSLSSAVMAWARFWHPAGAMAVLAAASAVAAATALAPGVGRGVRTVTAFRPPRRFPAVPLPREDPASQVGTDTMVLPVIGSEPDDPLPSGLPLDGTAPENEPVTGAGGPDDAPVAAPTDETTVFPAIRDDVIDLRQAPIDIDATQMIPRIRDDATSVPVAIDATSVMPAGSADFTAVFERISDSTAVLERVTDTPGGATDATAVFDRPTFPEPDQPAPPPDRSATPGRSRSGMHGASVTIAGIDVRLLAHLGILAAGAACWIVSLTLSSTANVGDYGLLSVMHPVFFVGMALCVTGFLIEIAGGARRGVILIAYLALLLLIMHATVPILIAQPEYSWVYKHVGVIGLFRTNGRVVDPSDIYEAWPTFFTGVAQLGGLAGAGSMRIARWGPLFFDAANCLPVYAIVRTLTDDRRMPYLTVFVFSAANWIGQDYLSPQAFAYVLCLGAILIMVRWLRRGPGPGGLLGFAGRIRLIRWLWTHLHRGLQPVPYVSRNTERAALAGLYFVYAIVVTAHQLSPYLIALSAGALVVLGLLRTWQVVPILIGIAVLYLIPHYGVVDRYGLFDGINIFKNLLHSSQGVAPTTGVSTAGQIFSAEVVQLLSLVLWGLSAIAVLSARNRLGRVALPAVLAFAPFGLLLEQSYGGEAIYRVYLFSVPWCVYLVCQLLLRVRMLPKMAALAGASVLVTAVALIGMQGEHGQLTFDQFTAGQVEAMTWVYDTAPAGTTLVDAAPNLPSQLSPRYVEFDGLGDPETLMPLLPTDRNTIDDEDMNRVDEYCLGFGSQVYVIIAQSEINYAHYFGYLRDGTIANLATAMSTSPYWDAVYHDHDVVIYQLDR